MDQELLRMLFENREFAEHSRIETEAILFLFDNLEKFDKKHNYLRQGLELWFITRFQSQTSKVLQEKGVLRVEYVIPCFFRWAGKLLDASKSQELKKYKKIINRGLRLLLSSYVTPEHLPIMYASLHEIPFRESNDIFLVEEVYKLIEAVS